jgi:hypothetical protein
MPVRSFIPVSRTLQYVSPTISMDTGPTLGDVMTALNQVKQNQAQILRAKDVMLH